MHKLLLVITALLLPTLTFADKSAGEHIDDSTITGSVKFALMEQSIDDATDINVETSMGVVQLAGWVDSEETKAMAGRVAKGVDGVKAVSNRLMVSPGKRSAGRVLDDSILATKVKFELSDNDATNAMHINVEVRNAVVELSGFVDSYEERNAAVDLIQGMEGVEKVINSIDITPN